MTKSSHYVLESHPSKNFNERGQGGKIKGIIAHYTALGEKESLRVLDGSDGVEVSAHYLISDRTVENEPLIYELVKELKRAWQAGISAFQGYSNLNDITIGIEIVNLSKDLAVKDLPADSEPQLPQLQFAPFADHQIQAFGRLAQDICKRHDISPVWITGLRILHHIEKETGKVTQVLYFLGNNYMKSLI